METLAIREVDSHLEESFRPMGFVSSGFESNELNLAFSVHTNTKSFDPENRWTTAELFETPNQSTFSKLVDFYRKLETSQYFFGPLLAFYAFVTLALIELRITTMILVIPLIAGFYYSELRRLLYSF